MATAIKAISASDITTYPLETSFAPFHNHVARHDHPRRVLEAATAAEANISIADQAGRQLTWHCLLLIRAQPPSATRMFTLHLPYETLN
jgi:hypothetical protein